MSPEEITAAFSQGGVFRFARWARPIAPVVFGVDDATLATIKGAIEAVVVLANHKMAETDPELGANLMLFFLRDWEELAQVPGLDHLVPDLAALWPRLKTEGANHYRLFRFEASGAIRACFSFLCLAGPLADQPAEDIALTEAARIMLLWGPAATERHPLARIDGQICLHPQVAGLIRASYDPILPASTTEPAHALRLAARMSQTQSD